MDRTILLACALSLPLFALARGTVQLDLGWEFTRDGESFRPVRVPHDWAVESDFDLEKYDGENGALPWKGVGTYRRTLVLDRRPAGKRYRLDFDGVLATSV